MWTSLLVSSTALVPWRHGAPRCCIATEQMRAFSSASGAICAFWSEVCEAKQTASSRRLLLCPDDADESITAEKSVLLEYVTSCADLVCADDDGCKVSLDAASDVSPGAFRLSVSMLDDGSAMPVGGSVLATDDQGTREQSLEGLMDWFTASLVAMDGVNEVRPDRETALMPPRAIPAPLSRAHAHPCAGG